MEPVTPPGRVVVLNGVPRSGKSSIAAEIIRSLGDNWANVGVDSVMDSTPRDLWPGIGLRPGGERPDLEPFVQQSYRELFDAVAVACRSGRNIVVDVGIHDNYSKPLGVWGDMQRRLNGIDIVLVGVHCSLAALRRRRAAAGYLAWERGDAVPQPVLLWHDAVHADKSYDVEVDTSTNTTAECVRWIRTHAVLAD